MHKATCFVMMVFLGIAWSLISGGTEAGIQKKAAPPPDRVKIVRQMYERIPPLIFEVVEPVEVIKATLYEDGGTIAVNLKDAKGKLVTMSLDGAIRSPTRWTMFVSYEPYWYSRKPVLLRGPEEAALYGVLVRWKATKQTEFWTRESVEAMLDHLDQRFAGEGPVKQKATDAK